MIDIRARARELADLYEQHAKLSRGRDAQGRNVYEDVGRILRLVADAPEGEVSAGYNGPSVVFPVSDDVDRQLSMVIGCRVLIVMLPKETKT